MKKFICIILISCLISNIVWGDCNWSTIKQLPDGGYEYSYALNLCVGKLVEDAKIKDQQIQDLNSAVQLKDLALTAADKRTQMWTITAENEQDRMTELSKEENHTNLLYFGLGVGLTFLAGYMTSKLIHP